MLGGLLVPATSVTNLARLRAGESFSPPRVSRNACVAASSLGGGPWGEQAHGGGDRASRRRHTALLPTMSLVKMAPSTFNAGGLVLVGHVRRPVEALLLARDGREDDRRVGVVGGHHPRQLQSRTATPEASSSAPGASAVAFMTFGDARVVVATDDVGAVGIDVAFVAWPSDVADQGGRRDPVGDAGLDEGLDLDVHPAAGLQRRTTSSPRRSSRAPRRCLARRRPGSTACGGCRTTPACGRSPRCGRGRSGAAWRAARRRRAAGESGAQGLSASRRRPARHLLDLLRTPPSWGHRGLSLRRRLPCRPAGRGEWCVT